MEDWQKEKNQEFFEMIIRNTKDGGTYVYPSAHQIYTIKSGKIVGTATGIEAIKEITPKAFHNKLEVETEH